MNKWTGKVAVVTGASSGIGKETCRQLVRQGMIVVGLARREDRLKELKKEFEEMFHYVKVDLRSEENILQAFKWIRSTLKSVDVLINNAGVIKMTDLLGNTEDWKIMFDTNVLGLNICSREAVKIMKERNIKDGHIVNINSISGHYHMSYLKKMAVYSSTKFCITALTEYLRQLMCIQNLPIRVTSISPGLVETEMTTELISKDIEENAILKPIDIADAIIYALGAPQRVNVAEIIIRPSAEKNMFNTLKALQ